MVDKGQSRDFKSKWDNYWYYYKYHTMLGAFVIAVIIILVFACQKRDVPVTVTVVDTTAMLGRKESQEMLEEFADSVDIDEDSVLYRNSSEYVDDKLTERTGVKGLKGSIQYGELEGVFVIRGFEYGEDYVGNIEDILPKELTDELGEDVMAGYIVTENGALKETDDLAGIIVNDAKVFKETYGEFDDNVVLQIPANCKNKGNAIAFVKYLFGLK